MIRCNLSILLAQRGLKISKVSADTGISRTTLTALSANRAQGIQFDTLNTLCRYLSVSPDKFLAFTPVDVWFEASLSSSESLLEEGKVYDISLHISEGMNKSIVFQLLAFVFWDSVQVLDAKKLTGVDVRIEFDEEVTTEDRAACIAAIQSLPDEFRFDLQNRMDTAISFSAMEWWDGPVEDTLDGSFEWPF